MPLRLFAWVFLILFSEYSWSADLNFHSWTGVGAGVYSQAFEIQGLKIEAPTKDRSSFFLNEQDRKKVKKKWVEYLPVALGFGVSDTLIFTSSQKVNIVDNLISLSGNIDWKITDSFSTYFQLNIDNLRAENYNHGAFLLKFSKWFTFTSGPKEPSFDTSIDSAEADQYYEKIWEEKEQALKLKKRSIASEGFLTKNVLLPQETYPHLQVDLILSYGVHLVGAKTFRNPALGSVESDQQLFQNSTGLSLTYLPHKETQYHFEVDFFFYNTSVDGYLGYLEIGRNQRIPLVTETAWAAGANQLFTFPQVSLEQSIAWTLNYHETVQILLNEGMSSSTAYGLWLGTTLGYIRRLSSRHQLSLDPTVIYLPKIGASYSGRVQVIFRLD